MRINTNIASMTAQESAANINKTLSSSLEKLSSGLRINKASDDASGMAIADKLRTQASSLGQSISNANSGNALVQIADKAMAEQSNILDIVKTKLIQAATETTSDEGRDSIRKDIKKLLTQLDNIATQTNYNGINLLNTKGETFNFQVGEDSTFDIEITTAYRSHSEGLGGGANKYTAAQTISGGGSMNLSVKSTSIHQSIAIGKTSAGGIDAYSGDRKLEVSASNVTSLELKNTGAIASITFTTNDENTKNMLLANDAKNSHLSYNANTGVFTFASIVPNSAAKITFSQPLDLGTLSISGLLAGKSSQSHEVLTIKNTVAQYASGEDLGLVTVVNKTTSTLSTGAFKASLSAIVVKNTSGDMTGGQLLSTLKNLSENGLTASVANSFMASIDEALNQLNTVRSDFGSTQNQLDSFVRNAMTTQTNIKAAESVIRDVDYAAESANFNKQNIIAQAGTYAMSQANTIQQNVMRLLQ